MPASQLARVGREARRPEDFALDRPMVDRLRTVAQAELPRNSPALGVTTKMRPMATVPPNMRTG